MFTEEEKAVGITSDYLNCSVCVRALSNLFIQQQT